MEEKNKKIREYIINLALELNQQYSGIMSLDKMNRAINRFENSSLDFDTEIKPVLDLLKEKIIKEYVETKEKIDYFNNNEFSSNELSTLDFNSKTGIYLSQQLVDLLMITEMRSKEEIEDYILNICSQFPNKNVNDVIENFDEIDLETAKRKLFQKYLDTIIDYIDNNTISNYEKGKHKLESLGIKDEELELCLDNISKGNINETLFYLMDKYGLKFTNEFNHFMNDDFENVKSVSYEEIESLSRLIDKDNSLDTIIIATGKFGNSMYNTSNGYIFDPYLTKKSLEYCKKHNKHMRYHALIDYSHLEKLIKDILKVEKLDFDKITEEDIQKLKSYKSEVLSVLKTYIYQSFKFIEDNNTMLSDGEMCINQIEIFNELVEKYNSNRNAPYEMVWEKYFGITTNDLMSLFEDINKPYGVKFMYNETTLTESKYKREKVGEVLSEIEMIKPDFIDTFGDQMHLDEQDVINDFGLENLKDTAMFLRKVQYGEFGVPLKIECTEHDFHFTGTFLKDYKELLQNYDLWKIKRGMQKVVSEVYNNSGVVFDLSTYWSLFDKNDHNLCRENIKRVKNKEELIETLYGGLIKDGKSFDDYPSLTEISNNMKK